MHHLAKHQIPSWTKRLVVPHWSMCSSNASIMDCNIMDHIVQKIHGSAQQALLNYQTLLFRDAHRVFTFEETKCEISIYDQLHQKVMNINVAPDQKVVDVIKAETKWQLPGFKTQVRDGMGVLNEEYLMQRAPIARHYTMMQRPKKQRKICQQGVIRIAFLQTQDESFRSKRASSHWAPLSLRRH